MWEYDIKMLGCKKKRKKIFKHYRKDSNQRLISNANVLQHAYVIPKQKINVLSAKHVLHNERFINDLYPK